MAPALHTFYSRAIESLASRSQVIMAARSSAAGFTLVEIAIVLALLGALIALAAPGYAHWIADVELANTARQLAESMNLARSEAMKHGGRVNLCKSADRIHCAKGGGWERGWLVFLDDNRDGQIDDDEPVVRAEPQARAGITARANQPLANYVSYTALGHARLISGALQMGTFTVCRTGHRAYHVVLANTGRIRIEHARDVCT